MGSGPFLLPAIKVSAKVIVSVSGRTCDPGSIITNKKTTHPHSELPEPPNSPVFISRLDPGGS